MLRIATWSGPRNVSTALMRSFEARGDCAVVDEPLYAAYLVATGLEHPGRDQIIASQPTDPARALSLLRSADHGRPLQYEKHMAHHWPRGWSLSKFGEARHAFLVRDPAAIVASYARVRATPRPEDLGLLQLLDLAGQLSDLGREPVVLDGDRLRAAPERWLRALCLAIGIPFAERMLAWDAGPRPSEGVWAHHWYASVEASTGFAPPTPPRAVPTSLASVVEALRPAYDALMAHHLRLPPERA